MNDLSELYGYSLLDSGSLLWTETDLETPNLGAPMFFYFDTLRCDNTFGKNIFQLKSNKPLTLIAPFYIMSYHSGRTYNVFDALYENMLGLKWNFKSNVEMRADFDHRNIMINFLKKQNMDGWIVPKEKSIYDMEICIFEPEKYLKVCGLWNKKHTKTKLKITPGKLYPVDKDAFRKMRISNSHNNSTVCPWWII